MDYAGAVKLNRNSGTAKVEVTVKTFVDGDTVHFYVPTDVMEDGVLKARFLAINTPESTGKIEEYGKAASRFTKERLSAATSILIESETEDWSPDSTGSRYLAWVWYKTAEDQEYRNLNVELLQNGLAKPNNAFGNQYGETCMAAIEQAKRDGLNLYSGEKDPDFYYGEIVELTLKELRTNIESYEGMQVAFQGVVISNSGSQGVYVEEYDPETDLYFGMYAYYGFNLAGPGLEALSVGNEVRIVGSVQYYEGGGTWQVSDLSYRLMKPDDPGNVQKLSEGHEPAWVLTEPDTFVNGQVTLELEDTTLQVPYAQLALGTSVEMKGLTVTEVYTTDKEESSSNGAMTLKCEKDGVTVTVRTAVLRDDNGELITAEQYRGKTIDVKGIVDLFDGTFQIKVFTPKNIIIME
ncbi:MAG: thermonuclease family protein [Oscillospiraceae bacterium]|nr:thermonuclease family protein [Oscillospiraceae bacterium]